MQKIKTGKNLGNNYLAMRRVIQKCLQEYEHIPIFINPSPFANFLISIRAWKIDISGPEYASIFLEEKLHNFSNKYYFKDFQKIIKYKTKLLKNLKKLVGIII